MNWKRSLGGRFSFGGALILLLVSVIVVLVALLEVTTARLHDAVANTCPHYGP